MQFELSGRLNKLCSIKACKPVLRADVRKRGFQLTQGNNGFNIGFIGNMIINRKIDRDKIEGIMVITIKYFLHIVLLIRRPLYMLIIGGS